MPGPLTVLMISDVLIGYGGSERSLCQLAWGLRNRGHKVIICCLRGGDLSNRMAREGFTVLNLNISKLCSYQGMEAFLKLIRTVRSQRVSVILSYHRDSDFMGFMLSAITRIPIVSTRRDMGYDRTRGDIAIYRKINPFFDAIATVSEAVKQAIMTTQGARLNKVTVIHNGVDLSSEARNGRRDGFEGWDEYIKIGCIANIRRIKGQMYLVDAAKLVFDRFRKVRFYLVGVPVDKNYYVEILQKIKEQGLEDVVRVAGSVGNFRVPTVWKSMDIAVIPSISEGMSNSLLEAMAAGKPVIATAVGGNIEVVKDGETGYLVPARDAVALAEGLIKLLLDSALRRDMGLRARHRAKMNFSEEKMVEKYEDLLATVCQRRNGKGQSCYKSEEWHQTA